MTETAQPFISVIMPIRNEVAFIRESLGAVLEQDYPQEKFEILIADGMSDDGTREIIEELKSNYTNLRLVDNPQRIVPTGFNAALSIAKGEIIVRIDGHAIVAKDFLSRNVELMNEHPEAWSTGGPIIHLAKTDFGKAVAVAMSHKLGVGNASHHFMDYEGYGEGVPFPAIRRWVFERVGNFDESLVRNQDDEFNFRMTEAGGKVFISPKVKYTYFVRERIKQLFRQYFQYGFWRIPVMKKHKQPTTLRQIVPMLFYLTCSLFLIIAIVLRQPLFAVVLPFIYSLALTIAAIQVLPRTSFGVACRVPFAIAALHAGYAFGMMYGFWASVFNRDAWNIAGRISSLSR